MHDPRKPLSAAQGYFQLGMYQDAYDELDELPPHERTSPEVLELRITILLKLSQWELAREVTRFLLRMSPQDTQCILWEGYCTRRIEGLEAARAFLMAAKESHSEEPAIHFNLGCYAAQLGNLEEAKEHVGRAIELNEAVRLIALEDPDLEPLWESWGSHAG